jgi:restriction endonuclease Mrr
MLMSIGERLHLLVNIPPAEGRLYAIKKMREFREELSISPEEMKEVEFREDGGMVKWNPSLDKGKEINIDEYTNKLIIKALTDMDKAESPRLKEEFISLYEKLGYVSIEN